MRNWFRGLKLNQKFTVTTLIFIFIPLFGMMCFGFRSIKKNAIDHGVNEAVTAIDLTCAEVNAKANACSMVVDTLQHHSYKLLSVGRLMPGNLWHKSAQKFQMRL